MYKTVLVWTLDKQKVIPFYKYNNGIGYIPADIHFQYRSKEYSTIKVMDAITATYRHIKYSWHFTSDDWNDLKTGKFDKLKFISLQHDFLGKQVHKLSD
jgi:hypothetical protein